MYLLTLKKSDYIKKIVKTIFPNMIIRTMDG